MAGLSCFSNLLQWKMRGITPVLHETHTVSNDTLSNLTLVGISDEKQFFAFFKSPNDVPNDE